MPTIAQRVEIVPTKPTKLSNEYLTTTSLKSDSLLRKMLTTKQLSVLTYSTWDSELVLKMNEMAGHRSTQPHTFVLNLNN